MNIKARCLITFKDGNILPDMVKIGQVINVSEGVFAQIQASGGMFEVLGKTIPEHVPAERAPVIPVPVPEQVVAKEPEPEPVLVKNTRGRTAAKKPGHNGKR